MRQLAVAAPGSLSQNLEPNFMRISTYKVWGVEEKSLEEALQVNKQPGISWRSWTMLNLSWIIKSNPLISCSWLGKMWVMTAAAVLTMWDFSAGTGELQILSCFNLACQLCPSLQQSAENARTFVIADWCRVSENTRNTRNSGKARFD